MSGFEELVERTRRELSGPAAGEPAAPTGRQDLEGLVEDLRARGEDLHTRIERQLAVLGQNAQPFDLRPDEATTPLRRLLGTALRALLGLGGLGKFLGANQCRANLAARQALELLEARSREQDRALAELAEALRARDREGRREDAPR
jgi:hypothetical protein